MSTHTSPADTSKAVDDFMARLDHPAKPELELLRRSILAVDPSISEGVKWKSPSFKTTEYFATTNLRTKTGIGLVLHFGAKVRIVSAGRETISDPTHLLKWVAKDRATIEFQDQNDLQSKELALRAILRQWIQHV